MSYLLFCLFPTFKERALLPIEVTWWAPAWLAYLPFANPVCDWECKGNKTFWLSKSTSEKFLSFSPRLFSVWPPPLEAGCKGNKRFWLLQKKLKIFFCLITDAQVIRPILLHNNYCYVFDFQSLILIFPLAYCDWECKGRKIFWLSKFLISFKAKIWWSSIFIVSSASALSDLGVQK